MPANNPFFTLFESPVDAAALPARFTFLIGRAPHALCLLAAKQLQRYLTDQTDLQHNFGLSADKDGTVIGKMFGVLVVRTEGGEVGYLSAFSGKMAGGNHHALFVPPVFDMLTENSFLNNGMMELTRINQQISDLVALKDEGNEAAIRQLKTARKNHSIALQKQLFDHYHFLNSAGEEKSLLELFQNASYKNPPSGAGECAGPKLLQYAFRHNMQPLAIAEFWWGQSPKSDLWKHGEFYPCCREKCGPILTHMLSGMDCEPQ